MTMTRDSLTVAKLNSARTKLTWTCSTLLDDIRELEEIRSANIRNAMPDLDGQIVSLQRYVVVQVSTS